MAYQEEHSADVSFEELMDMQFFEMLVSVDTLSSVLNWTLLHLAPNPRVQERL